MGVKLSLLTTWSNKQLSKYTYPVRPPIWRRHRGTYNHVMCGYLSRLYGVHSEVDKARTREIPFGLVWRRRERAMLKHNTPSQSPSQSFLQTTTEFMQRGNRAILYCCHALTVSNAKYLFMSAIVKAYGFYQYGVHFVNDLLHVTACTIWHNTPCT